MTHLIKEMSCYAVMEVVHLLTEQQAIKAIDYKHYQHMENVVTVFVICQLTYLLMHELSCSQPSSRTVFALQCSSDDDVL